MKKKRWIALVLSISLVLSGCSSVKTAWTTARFLGAMNRNPITGCSGNGSLTLQTRTLGIPGESGFQADITAAWDPGTGRIHAQADGDFRAMGLKVPGEAEWIGIPQDSGMAYGLRVRPPDRWVRGKLPWTLKSLDLRTLGMLLEAAAEKAEFQEILRNGEPGYGLSMDISPSKLWKKIRGSEEKGPELPGLMLHLQVEISGRDYLPREICLTLNGIDGEALQALFPGAERKLLSVTDGSLEIRLREFSYGQTEIPDLPPEPGTIDLEALKEYLKDLFP